MEVDQAPALELGHLGIGEPDPGAVVAGELVQAAAQGDGSAPPQFGRVSVPDDCAVVVVAVRAQRLAQAGVGLVVAVGAGQGPAVRAEGPLAAGAAALDLPVWADDPGVNGAEGGGGEGGEHARMDRHRLRDALAAREPGADQLVGVGPVGLGAGRADRGAAVPACGVDHPIGRRRSVLRVRRISPVAGVDVVDLAAQANRTRASASGGGLGEPGRVVIAGGAGQRRGEETGIGHGHSLL